MRPIALLLAVAFAAACASVHPSAPVAAAPSFIPLPAKAQVSTGAPGFALSDALPIHASADAAKEVALALSLGGVKTSTTMHAKGALTATLDPSKKAAYGDEGYALGVATDGITLTAATPAGLFRGATTLAQAVVKDAEGKPAIPALSIADAPRIAWRGFMLDVARHFCDTGEVKAILDQMALLKLNVLHMHLTDGEGWRIEIKKYPKLTSVGAWRGVTGLEKESKHAGRGPNGEARYGGFYTQDDIRELVAYAAARHIRIMPEIDMPGHMGAAAVAYPELSPANGWTPVIGHGLPGERCAALCVGRPHTVEFCKDVLSEVLELFPSKEIHIGGDEVFYEQWAPCPDMLALKEKLGGQKASWEDVQIAFGNDIAAFLESKGRTAVCWNNIYKQTVDKRVINHFWRNMADARNFANGGYRVLMSPYIYYFDYPNTPLEKVYKYDPMAIGVKPEIQGRLAGIEACIWTERVPTYGRLQAIIFPRLIALAESGWTPQEKKDWASFQVRLKQSPLFSKFGAVDAKTGQPKK